MTQAQERKESQFTFITQGKAFRNVIHAMHCFQSSCTIQIKKERIYVQEMDANAKTLYEVVAPFHCFDTAVCACKEIYLLLDLSILKVIVDTLMEDSDKITLSMKKHLILSYENKHRTGICKIPIQNVTKPSTLKINVEYPVRFTLKQKELQSVLHGFSLLATASLLTTLYNENGFHLKALGLSVTFLVPPFRDGSIEHQVETQFFLKAVSCCQEKEDVFIQLHPDYPIVICYDFSPFQFLFHVVPERVPGQAKKEISDKGKETPASPQCNELSDPTAQSVPIPPPHGSKRHKSKHL